MPEITLQTSVAPQAVGAPGTTTTVVRIGQTTTEVPIVAGVNDTTAPRITVTGLPSEPTTEGTLEFSCTVRDSEGVISGLSYSIDDGENWHPVSTSRGLGTSTANCTVRTAELVDGEYDVVIRASDNSGNESISPAHTIIVNQLPPVLGAVSVSAYGYNVPMRDNKNLVTTQTPLKVVASLAGGVTSAELQIAGQTYPFAPQQAGTVWTTDIELTKEGEYFGTLVASDGTDETITIEVLQLKASPPLRVTNASAIQLQQLNVTTQQWEDRQQFLVEDGQVSLVVPPGQWRFAILGDVKKGYTAPFDIYEPQLLTGTLNAPAAWSGIGAWITQPIKDFVALTSESANGGNAPYDVSAWEGKPVLLTTLTAWNRDARDQLAILADLQSRHPEITVVGVWVQEPEVVVHSTLERGAYGITPLIDETGQLASNRSSYIVPTHSLFNAAGQLITTFRGFQRESFLEEAILKVQ